MCVALAREFGAPPSLFLVLGGWLPSPYGRDVEVVSSSDASLPEFLLAASHALTMIPRWLWGRPGGIAAGVVEILKTLRVRRGMSVSDVAYFASQALDGPEVETFSLAEAGDRTTLNWVGHIASNQALLGWILAVGADPDLVFWLLGRFPDELVEHAGLAARVQRWQELLRDVAQGGDQAAETSEAARSTWVGFLNRCEAEHAVSDTCWIRDLLVATPAGPTPAQEPPPGHIDFVVPPAAWEWVNEWAEAFYREASVDSRHRLAETFVALLDQNAQLTETVKAGYRAVLSGKELPMLDDFSPEERAAFTLAALMLDRPGEAIKTGALKVAFDPARLEAAVRVGEE